MPPAYHAPSPGILHNYTSRLVAFEHARSSSSQLPRSFILWLGGLSDGLLNVKYPKYVSAALPDSWALAEVLTTSSYTGWTSGSLSRDAKELERAVTYFRKQAVERGADPSTAKIVLMGHSTGAQDAMEYLVGPRNSKSIPKFTLDRPAVNGIILQAGVSDREGVVAEYGREWVDQSLKTANDFISDGRGNQALPPAITASVFGANPSATRWVSLVSRDGDDDYFSSDLSNETVERLWGLGGIGRRRVPVMVLMSEKDEHLPSHVDPEALIQKWGKAVRDGGGAWDQESGVVENASHNFNRSGDGPVQDLGARVRNFVTRLHETSPDQSKF